MKKYFITAFIAVLSAVAAQGQTVYSVKYMSEADVKVYVAKYKSEADKKIYFVEYKSEADLVIYFAEYKSEAEWKDKSKKQLMY